jgi:hypothetical protein
MTAMQQNQVILHCMMYMWLLLAFVAACASPPATHTIEPTRTSGDATSTHWPDASSTSLDRADTLNALKVLHTIAEAWRANHGNECPTVQRLKDERELAASTSTNDAWGSPYKVLCDESETHVVSFGPDRREGTADDVAFP